MNVGDVNTLAVTMLNRKEYKSEIMRLVYAINVEGQHYLFSLVKNSSSLACPVW